MAIFKTPPRPVIAADDESEFFARGSLCAELSPWDGERAGISFGVTIVALTRDAVDLVDNGRFALGQQYLLEIPRLGDESINTVCTIVRTGRWKARAEFEMPLTDPEHQSLESRLRAKSSERITSTRTRRLFVLFGIASLALTLILDWI